jgi:hypothetical protein
MVVLSEPVSPVLERSHEERDRRHCLVELQGTRRVILGNPAGIRSFHELLPPIAVARRYRQRELTPATVRCRPIAARIPGPLLAAGGITRKRSGLAPFDEHRIL